MTTTTTTITTITTTTTYTYSITTRKPYHWAGGPLTHTTREHVNLLVSYICLLSSLVFNPLYFEKSMWNITPLLFTFVFLFLPFFSPFLSHLKLFSDLLGRFLGANFFWYCNMSLIFFYNLLISISQLLQFFSIFSSNSTRFGIFGHNTGFKAKECLQ